jgi:TP901-1 family phage major tail protein
MMAISGTDVLLLVNTGTPSVPAYEAVAGQTNVKIDEARSEIDISSKDSDNKRVLPGRYSSNLTLDALYISSDDGYAALKAAIRDGTLILVAVQEDGETIETADALITSLSKNHPDQDKSTFTASLTVDGAWTVVGS